MHRTSTLIKTLWFVGMVSLFLISCKLSDVLQTSTNHPSGVQIVAESTTDVPAAEMTIVTAGQAKVEFRVDSLSQDASVSVAQIENGDIAGGISVDLNGASLENPVKIIFPVQGDFQPGQIVRLVQSDAENLDWQPATFTHGSAAFGLINEDGSVVAIVDHFSAFALLNKSVSAAELVEQAISDDTKAVKLDSGQSVFVPIEFQSDPVLNGADFSFYGIDIPGAKFPWANKGLNDYELRVERYQEVLTELFMQRDATISEDYLKAIEQSLTLHETIDTIDEVGVEVAKGVATSGVLIKYSTAYRDYLRQYRAENLGWSSNTRLDAVAHRMAQHMEEARKHRMPDNIAAGFKVASDVVVVGQNVHRVLLYQSLNNVLIQERMDRFETLLNQQENVDPALKEAYTKSREDVEQLLDSSMKQFVDAIMQDWLSNLDVVKDVVVIVHAKSLLALAKLHPVFQLLTFAKSYHDVIVDAYADMQRATLAATLALEIFGSVDSTKVEDAELNIVDQAVMKTYLGQYFYHRVAERRRAGLIGGIRRLFVGLWSWATDDEQAAWEQMRLEHFDSKAQELKERFMKLEAERQIVLSQGLNEYLAQQPTPAPTNTPQPTPTNTPMPLSIEFKASKTEIEPGECVTFSWKVQGGTATHVVFDDAPYELEWNERRCPITDTSYTLRAHDADQEFLDSRTIEIVVTSIPESGPVPVYKNLDSFGHTAVIDTISCEQAQIRFDEVGYGPHFSAMVWDSSMEWTEAFLRPTEVFDLCPGYDFYHWHEACIKKELTSCLSFVQK